MATISPTINRISPRLNVSWVGAATGDTIVSFEPPKQSGAFAAVQFTGTFGSATVVLQGSNDGTNYVTLKDVNGTDISATAAAMFEFSTACRFLRVGISGGTGDDVDTTLTLRG